MGWTNYPVDLYHCLYAPAEILSGETEIGGDDTYTFVRRDMNGNQLYKCYYRRQLGTNNNGEQGWPAGTDEEEVEAFTEPNPNWPGDNNTILELHSRQSGTRYGLALSLR